MCLKWYTFKVFVLRIITYATQLIICSDVHVWRTSRNIQQLYLCDWSLVEARIFESMEEDEEHDYDHTFMDDSSAQGGAEEIYSVGEDNSNMCEDVVIDT